MTGDPHPPVPGPDESSIPELEVDQTIPPRPEEEIADVLRATPDFADHRGSDEATSPPPAPTPD